MSISHSHAQSKPNSLGKETKLISKKLKPAREKMVKANKPYTIEEKLCEYWAVALGAKWSKIS